MPRNMEPIRSHRLLVLELPLAHILEGERHLAADPVVDGAGFLRRFWRLDFDPTRVGVKTTF